MIGASPRRSRAREPERQEGCAARLDGRYLRGAAAPDRSRSPRIARRHDRTNGHGARNHVPCRASPVLRARKGTQSRISCAGTRVVKRFAALLSHARRTTQDSANRRDLRERRQGTASGWPRRGRSSRSTLLLGADDQCIARPPSLRWASAPELVPLEVVPDVEATGASVL
jgi:hypothetical protein